MALAKQDTWLPLASTSKTL